LYLRIVEFGSNQTLRIATLISGKKMMRITRLRTGLVLCTLLIAAQGQHLLAAENAVGDAPFRNGGIGQEDADAMRATAGEYNLRLYFSVASPAQVTADVKVQVLDSKGNIRFDTESAGPKLFILLPKGRYKVLATYNGALISRNVVIQNRRGVNVYLNWSAQVSHTEIDKQKPLPIIVSEHIAQT